MAIAFEHPLRINKTAPALLAGVICWAILVLAFWGDDHLIHTKVESLEHHLIEISEILFFLLGAMTIVELIDLHDGFSTITDRISTTDKRVLLWIVGGLSFFLSAMLDNLTTAIVMSSLLRKLIKDPQTRMLFAGMVVVAANAGGAWSPIGDVTTTMLWIDARISTGNIIAMVFLPSLVAAVVPLAILSFQLKGKLEPMVASTHGRHEVKDTDRRVIFFSGLGLLLFVPIFKTVTHLPPYMGMLFGLGILWIITEFMHKGKAPEVRSKLSAAAALQRIDTPSILFFLGILTAVAALQEVHVLADLATWLDTTFGNLDIIIGIIGVLSAIVDNVPLVAASMSMYSIEQFPMDDKLWEFLAYCAGTGGSLLIIGSAAGVAIMGLERIEFFWYLKKISLLALIGYIAGIATYLIQYNLVH